MQRLCLALLGLAACSSGDDAASGSPTTMGQTVGDPTTTDDPTGDEGTSDPPATTEPPTTATSTSTTGDGNDEDGPTGESSTGSASDTEAPTDTGTSTTGATGMVVMETSMGTIGIELFADEAPITVANFVAYIDEGFYDGGDGMGETIVHRVIPGFVIQGGGLTEDLEGKATMPPIVNEHGTNDLINLRGTLSMARTKDPDSATSQFFINLVDNDDLDAGDGYAVFAAVVEGMDVVDAIAGVETVDMPPFGDVPVEPILIMSVTLE